MRVIPILATLMATSAALNAAASNTMAFGKLGLEGRALPPWPKSADTIHVVTTEQGSPADGMLKAGDVVVGIDGKKFTMHPISELADIRDEVEASDGKLSLMLQNGESPTLPLPKLGVYSPSAPLKCPITDRIIEQTAARLLAEKGLGASPTRRGLSV